ncbi:MAG: hypothetical protein U1E76_10755 [Planctomycetota bacterium]
MATKKQIDDANTTIKDLDHDAQKQLKKLEGETFATELEATNHVKGDWKEFTLGKAALKIEGGFLRVQVGPSDTVVHGFKGEAISPLSTSFILGAENKMVVGLAQTRINGAKSDDIGGAKFDNLLGIKYERKASKEIKTGPAPGLRNEILANDKMNFLKEKFGDWGARFAEWFYKVDENKAEIKKLEEQIATVENTIKNRIESGKTYQARVDSYKDTCSSKADLKAPNVHYDCNGWQARARDGGSKLNMSPSSQCFLESGKAMVICNNGNVDLYGPKVCFGKAF